MITNGNQPPPLGLLEKLESRIDSPLPADYRKFLESHNGGKPQPNAFFVPGCDTYCLVDCLLGIQRKGEDIFIWMDELDDLQGQFIAIGFDPGSNVIILDYFDGKVYYWDSGRHFKCSTDDENAFWVADSFDDFLAGLTPLPDL